MKKPVMNLEVAMGRIAAAQLCGLPTGYLNEGNWIPVEPAVTRAVLIMLVQAANGNDHYPGLAMFTRTITFLPLRGRRFSLSQVKKAIAVLVHNGYLTREFRAARHAPRNVLNWEHIGWPQNKEKQ